MANLEIIGTTDNLIVNGDAEMSASNAPCYGWHKLNGNCEWGAFTEIKSNGKTIKKHSGSYFFAPADKNEDMMKNMILMMTGAPVFVTNVPKPGTFEKNPPRLIPPGYTPGSMPVGHKPPTGTSIWGMAKVPGYPKMQDFPGANVPMKPPSGISGISGIAGIASMLKDSKGQLVSFMEGLPFIPGVMTLAQFIYWAVNTGKGETTLVQEIDVSLWKNFIDAGVQTFDFEGYYSSNDEGPNGHKAQIAIAMCKDPINVEDSTIISERFKSGGKDFGKLAEGSSGYIYSDEKYLCNWNNPCKWTNYPIPKGTRKIYVFLRAWRSFNLSNTYYAGYFDDIKLTMPVFKIPVTNKAVNLGATTPITPTIGFNFSDITYESLNKSVATVNNGVITGVKAGTATIKVTDPIFQDAPNEITVTVVVPDSAPVIASHPASVAISSINQYPTFEVVAAAKPNPSYQWQVSSNNGASWGDIEDTSPYSGVKSNVLGISNPQNNMNGKMFQCLVTNSYGTVKSNVATLSVAIPAAPAITNQPSNVTVNISTGQTATFSIGVTGTLLSYQWQVSNNGKTWTDVGNSSARNAELTLSNITKDWNGFMYRCGVRNPGGSVTSNVGTLNVVYPQTEQVAESGGFAKIIEAILDFLKSLFQKK